MPRILIIDDDPLICKSLGKYLRQQGHEVTVATDGKAGLKAAAAKPDLIICDYAMPALNGHGVISALRQDPRLEAVPFIFFSGCASREQMRQGMDLGSDDFIAKPAELSEILNAVNARLHRHQRQRERQTQELQKAVALFAGIVHDLGSPQAGIRWLAEAAAAGPGTAAHKLPGAPAVAAATPPKPAGAATFLATNSGRQHFVKLSEVIILLADGEYSKAYWGKDQHMMFRKPLKEWEQELPAKLFVRIHRKAIINLLYLDYVDKTPAGKPQVHLRDFKAVMPVSQRKASTLNRSLKGFSQVK